MVRFPHTPIRISICNFSPAGECRECDAKVLTHYILRRNFAPLAGKKLFDYNQTGLQLMDVDIDLLQSQRMRDHSALQSGHAFEAR